MSARRITAFFILLVCLFAAASVALGRESSNLFLPRHIAADDGQVSLFADYDGIEANGRVPVYLVNNTDSDLVLRAQDGDIYMKLEYRDDSGQWVRAQPHGYSWCGNSYIDRTVRAGYFMRVSGYQPINGERKTVRYSLYSQDIKLASNVGDGVVSLRDIERAARDVMSINTGSFEYVVDIATRDEPVQNTMDHMSDLRQVAIWRLGSERFDADESRRVLLDLRERRPDLEETVKQALTLIDGRESAAPR